MLIKGKSDKAFSENVRTEMHSGKPLKQSLAIAYSMKRKAQHKAKGGEVCPPGCEMLHVHNYADGGTVDDDETNPSPSPSPTAGPLDYSGSEANTGASSRTFPRRMKRPTVAGGEYAEGGEVMDRRQRAMKAFGGYAEGGFVDEEEASGYHSMPKENPEHMVEHPVENQGHDAEAMDMIDRIMMKRSMAKGYSKGGQVANDTGTGADTDLKPNQFDDLVLRDDDMEGADYTGANSGDEIGDAGEDERRRDIVEMIMKSRKKKDRLPNPA